jgi:hypothetical protein
VSHDGRYGPLVGVLAIEGRRHDLSQGWQREVRPMIMRTTRWDVVSRRALNSRPAAQEYLVPA